MVEYAIIAAFLVAAIIGVLHMYKASMKASYNSVANSRSGMMP
jgi:Flp pilus assembly pilin Flp